MSAALGHLLVRAGLVLLVGAALAAPGSPSAVLNGLPFWAPSLVVAAVAIYAALALPPIGQRFALWVAVGLALAVGLKLVAAATAPPIGLAASYWASASPTSAPERSTDFPWLKGATRIDRELDLRGDQFPVHFFNDAARFNFGTDAQPGRDQLSFSVRWQGWLLVPSDGERRFLLESNGPATLSLDHVGVPDADSRLTLSGGLHALDVDYARPEASVPFLRLSWDRVPGGPLAPVGGADVRWQPSQASSDVSSILGRLSDVLLAGSVAAWVLLGAIGLRRGGVARALLGVVPLLFLVDGLLLHAPLAGTATILSGLDDWLIYESSARDILLNGPLMDGGQGHAPPFYGQPLYPYVLALAHWLTGESLFGPLALQYAALGGVLVGTGVLASRAYGSRLAGLAAVAFFAILLQFEPEHFKVARQLFNENLYMPLVMACLLVVVQLARRPGPPAWWQALLTGGLLGLTAISRSQFLLFVPFGLVILLAAWRRHAVGALISVMAMLAGLTICVAPITARNWLVSGQFVPISSSGGASLLEFHRPPPGLIDQRALDQDPLYQALDLDAQTRTVLAFVRSDPYGYLATLAPLGAHSLGLQGRNDPGIYWPLVLTVLLYVSSFVLRSTRALHVWSIHAFVGTHLLVLMLFEADTYGYRLVMPMYAPMAVCAAEVPFAAAGWLMRMRRPELATRAMARWRAAEIGAGLLAACALLGQAIGLLAVWPDRETMLHGLAGNAAHAAATADRVGARAIYIASVDGTPRRYGSGTLPGLRYPWFKWFDPSRSVPMAAPSATSVYQLSELAGQHLPGGLVDCLGPPDAAGEVLIGGAEARAKCANRLVADSPVDVTFDGLARIDALQAPPTSAAGDALETRMLWQPLVAHPEPQQASLQLDDPSAEDGTLWGNSTLDLYPSAEWQPGEAILSRLPLGTDPSAIPQSYRLTLGMGPTRANAPPATATWRGARTDRVPITSVTLTPGSSLTASSLPTDMRAVEGAPLSGGGLELIGARPLPAEASIGGPLRVGLLWRALQDRPDASQFKMLLVRENGQVVQESVLPLFGGRVVPDALHAGNVVRDEQQVVISTAVPAEPISIEAELLDGRGAPMADPAVRLGSVKMTGRGHVFDAAPPPEAVFGGVIQLLSASVEPAQAKPADKVTLKLRWRAGAPMQQAYKVFVHVLDRSGQQVIAQRDAEPQDGKAPTPGWVVGEVIDDEYEMSLPGSLQPGEYPLEIGVYEPRSGERLKLDSGDNRLLLGERLLVR